jgi:predicted transcriptional regulator
MKPTKSVSTFLAAIVFSAPLLGQEPSPPPATDLEPGNEPIRPERPARPELNDELKNKLQKYKQEQDALRKALKDRLDKIQNPTREKIQMVTRQFKANHQTHLAAQKFLASQIKEGLKAARPERPSKPEVTAEVKEQVQGLQDQHKKIHETIQASKAKLKESLHDVVSKEERRQLLDAFRQDQKDLHEQMKNIQRQIRETMVSSQPNITADSATRPEMRRPPTRKEVSEARRTVDR